MKNSFHVSRLLGIWTITCGDVIYGEYDDKDEAVSHAALLAAAEGQDYTVHEADSGPVTHLKLVPNNNGLAS